jgi:AcrR family transcriptional regulator
VTRKTTDLHARVLHHARESFSRDGYAATTLEALAQAAGGSLRQVKALFPDKVAVAAALLDDLELETAAAIDSLPAGSIADRYQMVLTAKLDQLSPYRAVAAAVFSAALQLDQAGGGLTAAQAHLRAAFEGLVSSARDAPRQPAQCSELAQLLYTGHLLVILFWLYDRSAERRATQQLIDLIRDGIMLGRGALVLPPVARALTRLTTTLMAGFGL